MERQPEAGGTAAPAAVTAKPRARGGPNAAATADPRERLRRYLVERSYREGDFLLASGRRSAFYFDCKATTWFAPAAPLIGRIFCDAFRERGAWPRAVGGLSHGADPIALAIAQCSLAVPDRDPIHGFLVRQQPKDHGTERWVEGCAEVGWGVAVVDDVVTSGGSVLRAVERCRRAGLRIVQVAALIDRDEGGLAAIRGELGEGIPAYAIFRRGELVPPAAGSPAR